MNLSDTNKRGYAIDKEICDVDVSASITCFMSNPTSSVIDMSIPPPIFLTKELKRSRSRASKIERQRLALLKIERDDEIVNKTLGVLTSNTLHCCRNHLDDKGHNNKTIAAMAHRYRTLIKRAFILGVCKGDTKRKQQRRKESITYWPDSNGSFDSADDDALVDDDIERHYTHESSNDADGSIDWSRPPKQNRMESELLWIFHDDDEENKSRVSCGGCAVGSVTR